MEHNFNNDTDIQMYIINIHAMKSALANIGEGELSEIAQKLEQAGREKEINVLLSESFNFIEKLNSIISSFKKTGEENESIRDSEESLSILNEKLSIIKEACLVFDKKIAKSVLAELREETWSSEIKELLKLIAENLLHSEFDEASALIDNYKNP